MLDLLSVDELSHIFSYLDYDVTTVAITIPLLNKEIYEKSQLDELWFSVIANNYLQDMKEHFDSGAKLAFRDLYSRKWYDSGKCYVFTGGNNTGGSGYKLDLKQNPSLTTGLGNEITFECRVIAKNITGAPVIFAISSFDWAKCIGFYTLYDSSTQNTLNGQDFRFAVNDWKVGKSCKYRIVENEWTHLAGTYDGFRLKLFINGELGDEIVLENFTPVNYADGTENEYHMTVGYSVWGAQVPMYYWTGNIAELRIWNEARTQRQIRKHMNRKLIGSENHLVFYAPMDGTEEFSDKTGYVLEDRTKNGERLPQAFPEYVQEFEIFDYSETAAIMQRLDIHSSGQTDEDKKTCSVL